MDIIYTDQGVKIVDLNPRIAGWYHERYTRYTSGICTKKVEALIHMNIRYIPIAVPSHYFTIEGISYIDPKETEGFNTDHYYEICPEKNATLNENSYFRKIDVYKKNYNNC